MRSVGHPALFRLSMISLRLDLVNQHVEIVRTCHTTVLVEKEIKLTLPPASTSNLRHTRLRACISLHGRVRAGVEEMKAHRVVAEQDTRM
jgi:hypothetical protein